MIADVVELFECPRELVLIADFRNLDGAAGAGRGVESEEGDGVAGGGFVPHAGIGENFGDLGSGAFLEHADAFIVPGAEDAPLGGDHVLDAHFLRRGDGLVFGDQGIEELCKLGTRFAGEQQNLREQAMLEAVAGGIVFTVGRDWAAGDGSVAARGFDLGV